MQRAAKNRYLLPRLLAVGVVLPAVFVASDKLFLSAIGDYGSTLRQAQAQARHEMLTQSPTPPLLAIGDYNTVSAAFFIWLALQTALISFAAGKLFAGWLWRLFVLGWALLLLNSLLFDESMTGLKHDLAFDPNNVLAFAFVSTQFSLVATWLVLGAGHWQWRIPATILLLPAGFLFAQLVRTEEWAGDVWNEVTVLQPVLSGLLAFAMRWYGFRIVKVAEPISGGGDAAVINSSQFSLSQLLVWTAAIAPFLLLVPTFDYVFPHTYGMRQWGVIVIYATLLALVVIASIWAALGTTALALRVLALAFIAAAIGLLLRLVEDNLGTTNGWTVFGRWSQVGSTFSTKVSDAGMGWLAWTEFSSSLVLGMLLVLRANSYRLVRLTIQPRV